MLTSYHFKQIADAFKTRTWSLNAKERKTLLEILYQYSVLATCQNQQEHWNALERIEVLLGAIKSAKYWTPSAEALLREMLDEYLCAAFDDFLDNFTQDGMTYYLAADETDWDYLVYMGYTDLRLDLIFCPLLFDMSDDSEYLELKQTITNANYRPRGAGAAKIQARDLTRALDCGLI